MTPISCVPSVPMMGQSFMPTHSIAHNHKQCIPSSPVVLKQGSKRIAVGHVPARFRNGEQDRDKNALKFFERIDRLQIGFECYIVLLFARYFWD